MLLWRLEFNKSRMVLLVALLFTTLSASVYVTPPILFMVAVLCGIPLSCSIVGRLASRSLRLKRQFPAIASVGDVVAARLTLFNGGPFPAFLVHCRTEAEAGGALKREGEEEHLEPIFMPRASVTWEELWRLTRRGAHELPRAGAGSLDPLGLFTHLSAGAAQQEILVLPRPLKIGRLGWSGGGADGVRPPLQAARVADAADFHGIRAHRRGEELRRIHWKSTARTGQLHVVEWEEEIAADLTLFLDVQASVHAGEMGRDSLESVVTVAATIAAFLLESGHRFGMMWCEDGGEAPSGAPRLCRFEARNLGGLQTMLAALARLQACRSSRATLSHLVSEGLRFVPQQQGILLVTTDWADWSAASECIARGSFHGGAPSAQTLIFEAASFAQDSPQSSDTTRATARPPAPSKQHRAAHGAVSPLAPSSPVRHGESLAKVLERGA